MHQAAATLETIQVLALSQVLLDSRLYYYHAYPQNHVNSQNKQGAPIRMLIVSALYNNYCSSW